MLSAGGGPLTDSFKGLELAKLASLPGEVMKTAWTVATKLNDLEEKGKLE